MMLHQQCRGTHLVNRHQPSCTPSLRHSSAVRSSLHHNKWAKVSQSSACPGIRKSSVSVSTGSEPVSATGEQEVQQPAAASPGPMHTDALIIGGGPAGLAAAIMLAKRGWNVTLAERHAQVSYSDPDRSYVYAIDGRGRQFTDKYGITPKLADAGVDTKSVTVTRVFPSGKATTSKQLTKDDARIVYWLPRNNFVRLLEYTAKQEPYGSFITLITNTEASEVVRQSEGGRGSNKQLRVTLRNTVTGNTMSFVPKLLLGCDGMNSIVRTSLKSWAAEDAGSSSSGSNFSMVEHPSLSTNLRFKVLQLPPNPAMADGTVLHNPSFGVLAGKKAAAIAGALPLRLGLLPIKDETAGRTANLITLPDHPVWNVSDAESMYKLFEESLPQANWRALVPEPVMTKFAASKGGQFPAPQYSQGLTMVVADATGPDSAGATGPDSVDIKGSGVVLLGDSAHCFPPDLGQGVNSALEDVCVLEQQLGAAHDDLVQALPGYEQQRMPDAAALVKLVQTGFPLQYNQYPRLRMVWTAGFIAQTLLNKLLPFLVSPPLFLMIQDPARRYSSILSATERSRKVVAALGAVVLAGLVWVLQKVLPGALKGLATGSV